MATKYDTNTDWIAKEKRELFCKAVNSMMMTEGDGPFDEELVLGLAKKIVDTAFQNYPDKQDEEVIPV